VSWRLSGTYFENCTYDVESAEIEFVEDGPRHSVRIGDVADVEVEDFVPEGADEPTRLTGFGIELDAVGKNGLAAPFTWTG
jgi:hypothetical protein